MQNHPKYYSFQINFDGCINVFWSNTIENLKKESWRFVYMYLALQTCYKRTKNWKIVDTATTIEGVRDFALAKMNSITDDISTVSED